MTRFADHHLNFRQVETFKAVVECGSMTRAAARLGVTQPAVSKLTRALERRVGFALFDRRAGRLVPTAEGRLLYEDVDGALIGFKSLAEKADDIRERRYGRLAVGAMPALSWGLIQGLIADLVAEHPAIRVSMQTRTSPQLMDLVAARQLDAAALAHLGANPLVEIASLHRIRMVCVLPANHRLSARPLIRAGDIGDETLIALSMLDQLRPRVDFALLAAGVRPKSRIDTALAVAACAFAAKGLGLAIVDPFSASAYARPEIAVRPFEPEIEIEIAVVRPAEVKPSSLARELMVALGAALDQPPDVASPGPAARP